MNAPETILQRYIDAVNTSNKEALLALYVPDVRIYDMSAPWEHQGIASWSSMVDQWFGHVRELKPEAVATNIQVHKTGEMALMTMFMEFADFDENGERGGMQTRLSWVLIPDGNDWKILHEHNSVPLHQDDMTPIFHVE